VAHKFKGRRHELSGAEKAAPSPPPSPFNGDQIRPHQSIAHPSGYKSFSMGRPPPANPAPVNPLISLKSDDFQLFF